jgi:hypothetical protein
MSFAERWLRYLEEKGIPISSLFLIGDRPSEIPYTKIEINNNVEQFLPYNINMKISDEIKITPVPVKGVKIHTNDYIFDIDKDMSMKIVCIKNANDIGVGEKEEIINKARELGYKVKSFEIADADLEKTVAKMAEMINEIIFRIILRSLKGY